MHLSIDTDMNVHAIEITDLEGSDIAVMDKIIPEDPLVKVGEVIADGAHYSIEGVQDLHDKGIKAVIPPPPHSIVHGKPETARHDEVVQYIKDKGTVYAFHKKNGYGRRSLVEAQMSRIKRCIGSCLKTQRTESPKREGVIIANILNRWNSFGMPISVKVS